MYVLSTNTNKMWNNIQVPRTTRTTLGSIYYILFMNNPLIDKTSSTRKGKSVPERNNDKRGNGNGNTKVTNSLLVEEDDWDYLLGGSEQEYIANFDEGKKKTNASFPSLRCLFIFMFVGGVIMTTASSLCAVYAGLTYQDVHSSYAAIQKYGPYLESLTSINSTDISNMKDQMRSINDCISERYCKRIHEHEEDYEEDSKVEMP